MVILMDKILEVEHLVKYYGNNMAVNNVSFTLEKGKIYGLLGPNGAGKTTVMKLISNLIASDGGNIKYGDIKINYLMDVPQFYEYMKVEEYLIFLCQLIKLENYPKKVEELLNITNLYQHKDKKIKQLSRGLRQKLGIASVLVNEIDLLILDEPISALDPLGRKEILNLIHSLKGKMCVIFSSHVLEDIEKVCDHILLINNGKIILNDTCENVLKVDNELLVRCENREQTLLLKEQYKDCEFSTEYENTLVIKYENLITVQQDILKKAKKLQINIEQIEKRRKTLEEAFLSEVKNNA